MIRSPIVSAAALAALVLAGARPGAAAPASGQEARAWPREEPADSAGMSAERLAEVDRVLEAAIADSATPGAALAVGRHGRIVRLRGYGRVDWAAGSAAVTDSTLYDAASLTKVVATTTALMTLVADGRLDLDRPVATYLPWWGDGGKEAVTVRQLLLHRGGLPAFEPWWRDRRGRAAYRASLAALPLAYPPGDSTVYSDLGFITLGFLVEEIAGEPLDGYLAGRVFAGLGMRDTGFRATPPDPRRIAPTEVDTVYRHAHVWGVVHDENAYAMGGVAGHAGLFSSARDLARFAQAMLDGARSAHEAEPRTDLFVPAMTIARFAARHDSLSSRGLGWDTPSGRSSSGDYFGALSFGHTGFTGTSLWIDPERDVFVVLLTNRVNPTRENQRHVALRRAVHDAVALAIADQAIVPRAPEGP